MSRISINSKIFFPAVSSLFTAKGPYKEGEKLLFKVCILHRERNLEGVYELYKEVLVFDLYKEGFVTVGIGNSKELELIVLSNSNSFEVATFCYI